MIKRATVRSASKPELPNVAKDLESGLSVYSAIIKFYHYKYAEAMLVPVTS